MLYYRFTYMELHKKPSEKTLSDALMVKTILIDEENQIYETNIWPVFNSQDGNPPKTSFITGEILLPAMVSKSKGSSEAVSNHYKSIRKIFNEFPSSEIVRETEDKRYKKNLATYLTK